MENLDQMKLQWHKEEAINCFNRTWDLIDKKDRSHEEDIQMIHLAHASRYHWQVVGKPLNWVRGEWQISRVYSLLGMGESALLHGRISLELCKHNNIKDLDLAFAYEALSRAHHVLHNHYKSGNHFNHAMEASQGISNPEDREYFLNQLNSILR